MTRKICVVTGSRAEYGLLKQLLGRISTNRALELRLVATGMHLSPEFGLTYREIEQDGFSIARKVEMLLSSDSSRGVAKSIGLGVIGFADAFADLAPDMVVLLGDRFETLAAATAALVAGVPIAHIHGGEKTEGAFDESIRHAITKMAHLHFVAAEEYRLRVIQLGEEPARVHCVGGLGVDAIDAVVPIEKSELERDIGFSFGERNLLVTFHPATLDRGSALDQLEELLSALADLPGVGLIFTHANADTEGRAIIRRVEEFARQHPHARAYASLGQRRYLSCLRHVDGVVGNSSSGLLEAPSFCIGTVNIGSRQQGRLRGDSVIDCDPTRHAIAAALDTLFSPNFRAGLTAGDIPYGTPGASRRIVDEIARVDLARLARKAFYDLPQIEEKL